MVVVCCCWLRNCDVDFIQKFAVEPGKPDQHARGSLVRPNDEEKSKVFYGIEKSKQFYKKIADVYDARLTGEYLETLRIAGELVLAQCTKQQPRFKVLDVGAGTGLFVRELKHAPNIDWTYLEPSHEMATVLRNLFDSKPTSPTIHECYLEDCTSRVVTREFDAVGLNSVLSSMQELPDFSKIAALLRPGGVLIISDGHPDIQKATPSFRVRLDNGIHELAIQHRSPSSIDHEVRTTGLFTASTQYQQVTKQCRLYSFVLEFTKI